MPERERTCGLRLPKQAVLKTSTVKIHATWGPQDAIMPETALRASSQIIESLYILERHL